MQNNNSAVYSCGAVYPAKNNYVRETVGNDARELQRRIKKKKGFNDLSTHNCINDDIRGASARKRTNIIMRDKIVRFADGKSRRPGFYTSRGPRQPKRSKTTNKSTWLGDLEGGGGSTRQIENKSTYNCRHRTPWRSRLLYLNAAASLENGLLLVELQCPGPKIHPISLQKT